jgi:prolipoprotein diacylglyceryl transferase
MPLVLTVALPVTAAIPPPPLQVLELGPLTVHLYGILIAFGAYLALRWTISRYAALGGDEALAERAGLAAILFGFLGARIAYVLPRLDRFAGDPLGVLRIWEGGLALFGGLLAGTLAVIVVTRRGGGSVPAMADAVAPGLPLAQAIGRWGNYFNQELYGRPTDLPWALEVEPPFRRPGFAASETFHPTFLYESIWNLALVGVLLRLDRRGRLPRGALILVYALGYGLGRFLVELIRVDTVERYAGLSRNNWVALLVALGGLVGLLRLRAVGTGTGTDLDAGDATDADRATGHDGTSTPPGDATAS